jgi:archaellum component FlaC
MTSRLSSEIEELKKDNTTLKDEMEELKNDNTTLKDNYDVLAAKVDILSAPKKAPARKVPGKQQSDSEKMII